MNNSLQYKGYLAKIEYSAEDQVLVGTVIGVEDTLIFEGEAASEIEQEFHEVVDDYLDMCKRLGKEPDKAYKGTFNIRITPQLHKQAALKAASLNITLNEFVQNSIQNSVNSDEYEIVNQFRMALVRYNEFTNKAVASGKFDNVIIPYNHGQTLNYRGERKWN